jgi:hypothetical protein
MPAETDNMVIRSAFGTHFILSMVLYAITNEKQNEFGEVINGIAHVIIQKFIYKLEQHLERLDARDAHGAFRIAGKSSDSHSGIEERHVHLITDITQ